jgi:hypothetical protein
MKGDDKRASEHALGSIQRVAMMMVDVPKPEREEHYSKFERSLRDDLRKSGLNDHTSDEWARLTIDGIRDLVQEIENSGGAAGGQA